MSSSASTNTDIAAMTQSRKKWKLATSCITGDAESCRSICYGVGWPSPAQAAPALANTPPALAAIAAKRDNAFMPRLCSLLLILPQPLPQQPLISAQTQSSREPPRNDATRFGGALFRGAMSLAGLAATREFRFLQTTNPGLLQCTHDRSDSNAG